MATAEDVSQLSFEAALARLEEIVRALEKGEAPLDQSIELYQEGDRLKRHCEALKVIGYACGHKYVSYDWRDPHGPREAELPADKAHFTEKNRAYFQ